MGWAQRVQLPASAPNEHADRVGCRAQVANSARAQRAGVCAAALGCGFFATT